MTREPDPIETQIRGLIGFHCADQAAFTEMVAWLDRTAGRLGRLDGHLLVWCGHEYTEKNLEFALAVEPESGLITATALTPDATHMATVS